VSALFEVSKVKELRRIFEPRREEVMRMVTVAQIIAPPFMFTFCC
jgi:hypothetical protein